GPPCRRRTSCASGSGPRPAPARTRPPGGPRPPPIKSSTPAARTTPPASPPTRPRRRDPPHLAVISCGTGLRPLTGRCGSRHNGLMATHVALLRGINLGGRNKVAMADLRAVVGELGHTDVSTYIQSGNVLFSAAADADTGAMELVMTEAIAAKLGVVAPVIVLARDELARVIADNPFHGEPDPRRVHAVVLTEPPSPELAGKLDAAIAQSAA